MPVQHPPVQHPPKICLGCPPTIGHHLPQVGGSIRGSRQTGSATPIDACPRSSRPAIIPMPVPDHPRRVLGRILFGVTSPEQMCRCRTPPAEVLPPAGAHAVALRGTGHGGPRHDLDARSLDDGTARPARTRRRLQFAARRTSRDERSVLASGAGRRPTALPLVAAPGDDRGGSLPSKGASTPVEHPHPHRGRPHRVHPRRRDLPPAPVAAAADGDRSPLRGSHDRPPRHLRTRVIRYRVIALDADPSVEARHPACLRPPSPRPPRRPSLGRLLACSSRA